MAVMYLVMIVQAILLFFIFAHNIAAVQTNERIFLLRMLLAASLQLKSNQYIYLLLLQEFQMGTAYVFRFIH